MALVVDTGPIYATLDRADNAHAACVRLLSSTAGPIILPAPVLPEVDYLIHTRLSPGVAILLLADINAGNYRIEDLNRDDYRRVEEIMRRYADARIGFVDAAVLAIVERLGETKLATLDRRHFGLMRPRHVDALELLPA